MKKKTKKNWPLISGIVGIALMLISPWLFTRYTGWLYFDSTDSAIGDTIGGITAPIASLIGSLLVYFALREQIKANDIINRQLEKQAKKELSQKISGYILEEVKFIKNDIDSFLVIETTNGNHKENRSIEAIDLLVYVFMVDGGTLSSGTIDSIPSLNRLLSIIRRFMGVWQRCYDKNLVAADADYLRRIIFHTYNYNIRLTLKEYEVHRPALNAEMADMLIFKKIYETYDWLNSEMGYLPNEE